MVLFAVRQLSGILLLMKNSVPLDRQRSPAPAHCLRDSPVPVILPVHFDFNDGFSCGVGGWDLRPSSYAPSMEKPGINQVISISAPLDGAR